MQPDCRAASAGPELDQVAELVDDPEPVAVARIRGRQAAADDTIPKVAPLFWSFRIMVGLGMLFLFIFAASFFFLAIRNLAPQRWLMRLAVLCIPLPWIASELGWFVAEYGRQPWTIYGVLPTHLSVSTLSVGSLYGSLAGFVGFYTVLLIVEVYLMVKFARQGPGSLGTGRYQCEPVPHAAAAHA